MTNEAEAMQKRCANVAYAVARERGDDDYGMATALRIARRIEALPLPAPEVPDVVRHFIECYDHDPMSGATRIAMRDLRSLYRKEYGI